MARSRAPIDPDRLAFAADMFKLMGHPLRLRIVEMLESGGELPAGAFSDQLEEPQPSISQHLNKMRMLGLLQARRSSGQVLYSVAQPQLFKLLQCIRDCSL